MVTLGQLVKFVLENRRGNAFRDHAEEIIASGIKRAADAGTLLYCCNEKDEVCGIATLFLQPEYKLCHVQETLTTEKWALPALIQTFREKWPEFELTATRRGRFITYNTEKFCNKILMKGSIYGSKCRS